MYAYIYGNLILQGVGTIQYSFICAFANFNLDVVGESQLMGYPTQFPSVSMMDYETAKPNARYWVLYLLHQNFEMGDKLVQTTIADKYSYALLFFIYLRVNE